MFKLNSFKVISLIIAVAFLVFSGCKSKESKMQSEKIIIQNQGSDTMVNVAQAWAEEYAKVNTGVSVEVSGGGSGTGIAALINGTVDIANASRDMEQSEVERAIQNTGKKPVKFVVGFDALAVYVNINNPLNKISIEQLADIYGEGGKTEKWSQLGIKNSNCSNDEIIRVSRQSNSGTYFYFRETLLGKEKDFKLGSRDLHGSKDVVELVERTPCAIGYSGMGYATDKVKILSISQKMGEETFPPSVDAVLDKTYPIARPLEIYSLGEPTGEVKKYIDWILSEEGQKIVAESGYVPLPKKAPISSN